MDLDNLLKDVLKNDRVAQRVHELKLTKEQMIEALPIMIDMLDEVDNKETKTLTSFYINDFGVVKRMAVLSTEGKRVSYMENIMTQDINPIDFDADPEFFKEEGRKEAVNTFSKLIKTKENNKGLYIYGDMGVGKTYMLKKFAKISAEQGYKVGFVNISNLVSSLKASFGNDSTSSESILSRLKKVDILFLDDIGAEKIASWFRDDFLFSLLNERMDKKRPTFFSSNYSIEKLLMQEAKTVGAKYLDKDNAKRLISRIKAMTIDINVKGTNKRY